MDANPGLTPWAKFCAALRAGAFALRGYQGSISRPPYFRNLDGSNRRGDADKLGLVCPCPGESFRGSSLKDRRTGLSAVVGSAR